MRCTSPRVAALCWRAWAKSPGWADGHATALLGMAFYCIRSNSVTSSASSSTYAMYLCHSDSCKDGLLWLGAGCIS